MRPAQIDWKLVHGLARLSDPDCGLRTGGDPRLPDDSLDGLVAQRFSVQLAASDDAVVLVFHGRERDPSAWLRQLEFKQARLGRCRVHRGLWNDLCAEKASLLRRLKVHGADRKHFSIAGHGVGGALATLAGALFADHGMSADLVVSFASPRVGDRVFAASYPVPLLRLEYQDDLVPHLPSLSGTLEQRRLLQVLEDVIPGLVERASRRGFRDRPFVHAGRLLFVDWQDGLRSSSAAGWPAACPSDGSNVVKASAHRLETVRLRRLATNYSSLDVLKRKEHFVQNHEMGGFLRVLASRALSTPGRAPIGLVRYSSASA